MKTKHLFILSIVLLLTFSSFGQTRWFKGNTHTHTTNSDGDSSPEEVAAWYKEKKYDFLFITDHEHITDVEPLNAKLGDGGTFLVLRGQEISDRLAKTPLHVNGLGLTRVVKPNRVTGGVVANIQKNVDAIRDAGGIAQINHPNYYWAITGNDLAQVRNATLVEICSGHPWVNMQGGGGVPSAETLWDVALTSGNALWAVAVDDAHHYKRPGDPLAANPGQCWIMVRASELSEAAILEAIKRGDFYSSNGVDLEDYVVTDTAITIKIKDKRQNKYTTRFIGAGGKLVAESLTNPAVYKFKGNEKYVRAKIFDSNGKVAWTQPVFRKKFKPRP